MRTFQTILAVEGSMPIGERAIEALKVSLLGIGSVFAVLAVIWLILSLFRVVFAREKKAPKAPVADLKVSAPKKAPQVAAAPAVAPAADYSVIAAISAAVAVVLESECAANGTEYNGFRVVSVRRSDKGRSWTQKN